MRHLYFFEKEQELLVLSENVTCSDFFPLKNIPFHSKIWKETNIAKLFCLSESHRASQKFSIPSPVLTSKFISQVNYNIKSSSTAMSPLNIAVFPRCLVLQPLPKKSLPQSLGDIAESSELMHVHGVNATMTDWLHKEATRRGRYGWLNVPVNKYPQRLSLLLLHKRHHKCCTTAA